MVTGIKGPIVIMFVNNIKVISIKKSSHIEKVKRELLAAFEIVNIAQSIST